MFSKIWLKEVQSKILKYADHCNHSHANARNFQNEFHMFFFIHKIIYIITQQHIRKNYPHRLKKFISSTGYPMLMLWKKCWHQNKKSIYQQKIKRIFKLQGLFLHIMPIQQNCSHQHSNDYNRNHLPCKKEICLCIWIGRKPVKLRQIWIIGIHMYKQWHKPHHQNDGNHQLIRLF